MKHVKTIQYNECFISRFLDEIEMDDIKLLVPKGIMEEELYNCYPTYICIHISEIERLKQQGKTDNIIKAFIDQTQIRSLLIYSNEHEMLFLF